MEVPTAITLPGYTSASGEKATETATASTGSGNLKLCTTAKEAGSITRTAPSSDADSTRDFPCEGHVYCERHVTCFAWTDRRSNGRPEPVTSNTQMLLSLAARSSDALSCSSEVTACGVASVSTFAWEAAGERGEKDTLHAQVPQLHAVVEAAAHEEVAGGRARGTRAQTTHVVLEVRGREEGDGVAVVGVHDGVRGNVVETDRFVVAAGEKMGRRLEVHTVNGTTSGRGGECKRRVWLALTEHRLRLHVKHFDVAFLVSRRQQLPVVAEISCASTHSHATHPSTRYPGNAKNS